MTERKIFMKKSFKYSGVDSLPQGRASESITEGCLVLEGGAFRGVYTNGVLDALMEEGINFRCTVGVSAGSLNAVNYITGQIGRSARINLRYRHDSRYVGRKAIAKNQGIIGFEFIFGRMPFIPDLDKKRFRNPERKLYAVVTNLRTGQPEYIEKNAEKDFFQFVAASSSMPFVSKPVMINDQPYLDGGCSCKIPYEWALNQNFENIIVIRTRPRNYRKPLKSEQKLTPKYWLYRDYPKFTASLLSSNERYNRQCKELQRLELQQRIFVIAPSQSIDISRLEGDMEKLGSLYYLGYHDMKRSIEELKAYLNRNSRP